jgi:hypothetical protein
MDSWKTVVLKKDFWIDYFRLMGEEKKIKPYNGLRDPIIFPVFEDVGFILDLTQDLSDLSLSVYHPSFSGEKELAYLNEGDWHPVLFRWNEVEKIGDFFAKKYNDLPSSVPFLLLSVFAPVTKQDDMERVNDKVRSAWQSLIYRRGN